MPCAPDPNSEVATADRRAAPRVASDSNYVSVHFEDEQEYRGKVVDESLRGIGVEFRDAFDPPLNSETQISYNGVRLNARVRHVGVTDSGCSRVGFEWAAKGYAPGTEAAGTNTSEEFFETLPSGLFVMLEFFEAEKWTELSETVKRLLQLADRCGMEDLTEPSRRLLEALGQQEPKEPTRMALHQLIERCHQLKSVVSASEAVATEVIEEPTVDPNQVREILLATIERIDDDVTVQSLGSGLRGLMASIHHDEASSIFDRMADARQKAPSEAKRSAFADTLLAITDRLPSDATESAFLKILTGVGADEKDPAVHELLNAVADRMPSDSAERIFEEIVGRLQSETSSERRELLGGVLVTVSEKLSMEAAARIAPGIICLMQQTRDEFLIESVSESMHVLVDKLTAQDVQATFHQIVFALEQTSTDSALRCLAQSLSTLTERLPAV